MPTIDDNKRAWDGGYQWTHRGDEWSAAWGGPFMQWYGTILPRIHNFIPTDCILEIACGYGRWTQFLKNICHNLIVIDISEECIVACKERFSECSHIRFYVNDGVSLPMVVDSSVDFVFSFDSLVHADHSVMNSYISELSRILKNEGVAFLHHSNLGEYHETYSRIRRIPMLEGVLKRLGIIEKNLHWRDPGVNAALIEGLADEHRLKCISQEIIPWGTKRAQIDCLSTLVRDGSSSVRNNRIFRNSYFMQEARNLSRLSHLYTMGKN